MSPARGGYVLVSVLWVVAMLTMVTLSYHHRARLEVQAARYSLDATQCRLAARGAVERGLVELQLMDLKAQLDPIPEAALAPINYLGQDWAQPLNLYAPGGLLDPGEGFEEDVALVRIEDLERRIDINTAPLEILENLPGLSRSALRAIHARRTGVGDAGAPPGEGPVRFHDIAELRDLDDVDEAAWRGEGEAPGLRDLMTAFGDGRINVNTAPAGVLVTIPNVTEEDAETIVAWREGDDGAPGTADDRPYTSWDQVASATGFAGDAMQSLQRHCKFDSDFFKITGLATRRGGRIRAACSAVVRLPNGSGAPILLSWSEESLGSQ